jgi:hypothetical protein
VTKKTGQVEQQLFFLVLYQTTNWAHFNVAADEQANLFPVKPIGSTVSACTVGSGNCIFQEDFAVTLPDDKLKLNGFRIKVSAQNGMSFVVPVTQDMIANRMWPWPRYRNRSGNGGANKW